MFDRRQFFMASAALSAAAATQLKANIPGIKLQKPAVVKNDFTTVNSVADMEVKSMYGLSRVIQYGQGTFVICFPTHPILTPDGYKPASELVVGDQIKL